MKTRKQQEGFAIFELVLVIVILALVVGAGLFVWKHHHKTATTVSTPAKQAQQAASALKSVDLASIQKSVDQVKAVVSGLSQNQ